MDPNTLVIEVSRDNSRELIDALKELNEQGLEFLNGWLDATQINRSILLRGAPFMALGPFVRLEARVCDPEMALGMLISLHQQLGPGWRSLEEPFRYQDPPEVEVAYLFVRLGSHKFAFQNLG